MLRFLSDIVSLATFHEIPFMKRSRWSCACWKALYSKGAYHLLNSAAVVEAVSINN